MLKWCSYPPFGVSSIAGNVYFLEGVGLLCALFNVARRNLLFDLKLIIAK